MSKVGNISTLFLGTTHKHNSLSCLESCIPLLSLRLCTFNFIQQLLQVTPVIYSNI